MPTSFAWATLARFAMPWPMLDLGHRLLPLAAAYRRPPLPTAFCLLPTAFCMPGAEGKQDSGGGRRQTLIRGSDANEETS